MGRQHGSGCRQPGLKVAALPARLLGRTSLLRLPHLLPLLALVTALLAPTIVRAEGQIALYASPTTRSHLPGVGGSQDALVGPWRQLLQGRGHVFRELRSPDELAALKPQDVLVLPSAVALSAAERGALLRFRDIGGQILTTWAVGARDAHGQWMGHGFLRELTGVDVTGEVEATSSRRFLIPYGDSAINREVPAGRRIWLGDLAERPLQLKGGVEAAAYLDWSRTVLGVGSHSAAIVYDEGGPRSARRVVFGYAETAWSFQPADFEALADQALRWLLRRPSVHLAAWPDGRRAAQLIEMDTEEGFANAIHFAELLEQIHARGTFYCLTSEARKHADLMRRLARHHEISFHGEVHFGFKGLPREKQQRRLKRMFDEMRGTFGPASSAGGWISGVGRGFRAPTESYDDTTEALLLAMGLRHHAADPSRSADRLPLFAGSADPAQALVVLPRGQLDDLNYMDLKLTPAQVGAALVGEYEFNLRLGGLGLLSVHSQNFADTTQLLNRPTHSTLMTEAMEILTRHIGPRHERAWIATGEAIADWWRQRQRAGLDARMPDANTLELQVTVGGTTPLQGLTVQLGHRAAQQPPRLAAATRPGEIAPQLRPIDRFSTALVFPSLAPGPHRLRLSLP